MPFSTRDTERICGDALTTSGEQTTLLALEKTIAASDLPVIRDLLKDRENALLVDPEDAVKFANALTKLVQDGGLREGAASGVRAMDFGEQFWISIAKRTAHADETGVLCSPICFRLGRPIPKLLIFMSLTMAS